MRAGWLSCIGVLALIGSSVAEAQLRVVVSDGETTPAGTINLPSKFSIDDSGAVAFMTADGDGAYIWRNGVVSALAKSGDPSPCGSGTISGFGDGIGGLEAVTLRGLVSVFDISTTGGVQRRVISNDGVLSCRANTGDTTSAGPLARFEKRAITNEAGEVLVDDSHLWLVPNAGGSYLPIAGAGATLPVPPNHTAGRAVYWALDDDGDTTVVVETSYLGGTRYHAFHGRPGAMTLIEPLGIDADAQWTIYGPDISVNRDGIVAYQTFVEPLAPASSFRAMYMGAPGATAKAFDLPKTEAGITIKSLYARPHVVSGTHFVAEMQVETTGSPKQALVRWKDGALTVIATTGDPLPGHPTVVVQRFGGVGVDETGTVYMHVLTGTVNGGIYRVVPGGAIEKLLASGDTLAIAGVDETIDGVGFETTHGTGYASSVSPSGRIVFYATYQGGLKLALVTFGVAQGPQPDLAIEIVNQVGAEDAHETFEVVSIRITNLGPGQSTQTLLTGLPGERLTCMRTLPAAGACRYGLIEAGASIEKQVEFQGSSAYTFTLEVSSDGQVDADPSNNIVSGQVEKLEKSAEGCCRTSGGPPAGLVPAVLGFLFLLRRRRSRSSSTTTA